VRLVRQNGEFVTDPNRLVGEVDIDTHKKTVSLNVVDVAYEKGLRGVFSGAVVEFSGGGTNPDGVHFDAVRQYQPWDKGYMSALSRKLREQTLGYIRVDRERLWSEAWRKVRTRR
jgi:hypothetical protein